MSLTSISVRTKLAVVFVMLLVPLAVLAVLFVMQARVSVNFAQQELNGLVYQREVWNTLNALQVAKADRSVKPSAILEDAAALEAAGAKFDAAFATGPAARTLSTALEAIGWPDKTLTPDAATDEAIAAAQELIIKIADGSNMTLDPDIDSYYVMTLNTLEAAGVLEHSGNLLAMSRDVRMRSSLTPAEKAEFLIQLGQFSNHAGSAQSALETAFRGTSDVGLKPALTKPLDSFKVATDGFITLMTNVGETIADDVKRASIDVDDVFALTAETREAAHVLWGVAAEPATHLVSDRIAKLMTNLWTLLGGVSIALALAIVFAVYLMRQITGSLAKITAVVERIAKDDLDVTVEGTARGDELGQVARSVEVLRQNAINAARVFQENVRIRVALDNCSTSVMLADNDGRLIYLNDAVRAMMRNAESDLRTEIVGFEAAKLDGANFDIFQQNPAHQRTALSQLKTTHKTISVIGGRTFNLVANPVLDSNANRLGSVIEWTELTQERAVEVEIDAIVNAAANGNFRERVSVEGKHGFMRNLAEAINRLSETTADALDDVSANLGALAEGDLSARIERTYAGMFDELKDKLNNTAERLATIVSEVMLGTNEVKNAAAEITSGTSDLSERTEQQASSLEETSSSMEEIAATIRLNAENAQQANQLVVNSRNVATQGGEIVGRAVEAMSRIETSSQKISDIIGVIDEIAFQTNLLALNAAVEAARAGDAGKGFAVVASEVRSLAQRSSEAAKDIKALIVESGAQVKDGVRLVNNAGESLSEIVGSVKKVADIVSEIAAASREQATGAEEINRAVSQMDEMTQQNSALVEENAAACRMLQSQAENMSERMSFFRVDASHAVDVAAPKRAAPALVRPAPAARPPVKSGQRRPAARAGAAKLQSELATAFSDDADWKDF
jgi:methyl-accepting chemotaxis protein